MGGGGGGETVAIQGDDDHDDECGGLHNGGRVRGFQASSPGLNISPLHGHGAMPWSHSLQTGVEKGQRETPRMTGPCCGAMPQGPCSTSTSRRQTKKTTPFSSNHHIHHSPLSSKSN